MFDSFYKKKTVKSRVRQAERDISHTFLNSKLNKSSISWRVIRTVRSAGSQAGFSADRPSGINSAPIVRLGSIQRRSSVWDQFSADRPSGINSAPIVRLGSIQRRSSVWDQFSADRPSGINSAPIVRLGSIQRRSSVWDQFSADAKVETF
ncbi:hypothetical protein CgunFtcFv8_009988 [Champsocephalus gunnari]|nr:hypothetical protein CgunFtcFv8_009988 [Champsocephalus gunnari]